MSNSDTHVGGDRLQPTHIQIRIVEILASLEMHP